MKKNLIAFIATLTTMVVLTGCQNESKETSFAEGEWKLTSIESYETVIEGEELDLSYQGEVIYTFNPDGTASLLVAEQLVEGTWEDKGDTVVMICNGLEAEFAREGDNLVASPNGIRAVLARRVVEELEETEEVESEEDLEIVEEDSEVEAEAVDTEVSEDDSEE